MNKGGCTTPVPLPDPVASALRLMWNKINHPDGCWEWQGGIHPDGYPINVSINGNGIDGNRYRPARLMFHWFKYELPVDLQVDHTCHNKKCVNPDHLRAVTHSENMASRRCSNKCDKGHPLVEGNITMTGKTRRCKLCYGAKLAAQRAARFARGLKKPGRKAKV